MTSVPFASAQTAGSTLSSSCVGEVVSGETGASFSLSGAGLGGFLRFTGVVGLAERCFSGGLSPLGLTLPGDLPRPADPGLAGWLADLGREAAGDFPGGSFSGVGGLPSGEDPDPEDIADLERSSTSSGPIQGSLDLVLVDFLVCTGAGVTCSLTISWCWFST